jgi:hypothetical protein
VAVAGKGYDFAEATRLLKHLDTTLDAVNPGACDLLRGECVDPVDVAFKLSVVLPLIISVPFNSSASANAIQAAVTDIADAINGAAPVTITKNKEEWLKQRVVGAPVFKGTQHGDTLPASAPGTADTDTTTTKQAADKPAPVVAPAALATVPVTVPELPEIMSERPEIVAEMRSRLLGADGSSSGKVALSSVKKSKLTTHGQGGAGKTTMAAAVARDSTVRGAFDAIGWVSVGQQPCIMEMQRVLFQQLAGRPMGVKDGATMASQLSDLQAACIGKNWLIVLDDVWETEHEKFLSCVDPNSASKLLVTTRIRGLIAGCEEVSLNLLSPGESVDLLLRTAQVEDAGEAPHSAVRAAALEIAALCGNLPLYLCICAGVIFGYNGEPDWQTELVAMLKDDRLGVIHDGSMIQNGVGGRTVELLLDTSLSMVDKQTTLAFMALGICPEDALVKLPVARLICGADADVVAKGKASTISVRGWMQTLLDRNLLIGSIPSGVQMHDIVRDLLRARIGEAGIRTKQRSAVGAFAAICPAGGWATDDAVGQYAALALTPHMKEALLLDPLTDTEAQAWLDASDDVLGHTVVRCAAEAFGHRAMIQLGEQHEANGQAWLAAKRFASAATSEELTGKLGSAGHIAESGATNAGLSVSLEVSLIMRSCGLLEQLALTNEMRALEVMLRGRAAFRLAWTHEFVIAGQARVAVLLEQGVDITSPRLLIGIGLGVFFSAVGQLGFTPNGESNLRSASAVALAAPGAFSVHFITAYDLVKREDPYWLVCAAYRVLPANVPGHLHHELGRELSRKHCPHELLAEIIDKYDFETHNQMMVAAPMGFDFLLTAQHATAALLLHGDASLARSWLLKTLAIFDGMDFRSGACGPVMYGVVLNGVLNWTNPIFHDPYFGDLSLRLMKSVYCTFGEIGATAELIDTVMKFMAYVGKAHQHNKPSYLIAQMKRRHWLLAPDEVGKAAMEEWLLEARAEWGSNGQGELIDGNSFSQGCLQASGCAEVFESLERYEEAIIAAKADIRNSEIQPILLSMSHAAVGRCESKLGRPKEATAAFEAAITEAYRCELHYFEMLARRDFIVYVLDAEGRREEQIVPLGGAISRMAMAPGEYTAILGSGIDAEEAVAAYHAQLETSSE